MIGAFAVDLSVDNHFTATEALGENMLTIDPAVLLIISACAGILKLQLTTMVSFFARVDGGLKWRIFGGKRGT
jgi:hypothetical protein